MADDRETPKDTTGKEAVPEGMIEVVLKLVQPHSVVTHKVEVDLSTNIGILKDEMESEINVPPDEQMWLYNNQELTDDMSLDTFVSFSGATIEVRKKSDELIN